ncbi:MAG: T9SS type A sorting domain-containing protein, partial [Bacteroidota bacterium]
LCFGYAGAVYKTTDGGKNWRNISVDKAIRINTAVIIDAETFLVAGEENTIYKTNDSGRSWRRMYFEAPKLTAHKAIRFFDDSYGVLVDWEGGFLQDIKIYETFDQGEHWQLDTVVTLASGQSPFANRLLYFEAEQNLFVLGGRQSERGGAGQIYQSVLQKLPTSLPTLASSVSISLYPNPSSEVVTITGLPNKATQLEVFDLQGQSQLSRKTQAAQQQVTLQLSGLAEGAYLLKITDLSGQQFYSHRFLIIR